MSIFYIIVSLIIPLSMFVLGAYYQKHPIENVNDIVGYRTVLSRKSQEAWAFAQIHWAKMWKLAGAILLPVSLITLYFLFGQSEQKFDKAVLILVGLQLLVMILSVIPTEIALRKNFDQQGKPK